MMQLLATKKASMPMRVELRFKTVLIEEFVRMVLYVALGLLFHVMATRRITSELREGIATHWIFIFELPHVPPTVAVLSCMQLSAVALTPDLLNAHSRVNARHELRVQLFLEYKDTGRKLSGQGVKFARLTTHAIRP
jgi:hypothetical protein